MLSKGKSEFVTMLCASKMYTLSSDFIFAALAWGRWERCGLQDCPGRAGRITIQCKMMLAIISIRVPILPSSTLLTCHMGCTGVGASLVAFKGSSLSELYYKCFNHRFPGEGAGVQEGIDH
eukprot:scaffold165133_cov16-Prasinocladus_malaysianus.AAC.2